jgi:catechol 2,3-dioxygenase-like lactoylglutathione lyase family enzyme
MGIDAIDHVNIRSSLMDETIAFYGTLLGLRVEASPGEEDPRVSAWVYAPDGRPVIHVNSVRPGADFLGETRDWSTVTGTGRIHHVAFECSDYDEMRARLTDAGLTLRYSDVPQISLRQIFAHDPNGVLLELNFR